MRETAIISSISVPRTDAMAAFMSSLLSYEVLKVTPSGRPFSTSFILALIAVITLLAFSL